MSPGSNQEYIHVESNSGGQQACPYYHPVTWPELSINTDPTKDHACPRTRTVPETSPPAQKAFSPAPFKRIVLVNPEFTQVYSQHKRRCRWRPLIGATFYESLTDLENSISLADSTKPSLSLDSAETTHRSRPLPAYSSTVNPANGTLGGYIFRLGGELRVCDFCTEGHYGWTGCRDTQRSGEAD